MGKANETLKIVEPLGFASGKLSSKYFDLLYVEILVVDRAY
jgi:hypothetical protein